MNKTTKYTLWAFATFATLSFFTYFGGCDNGDIVSSNFRQGSQIKSQVFAQKESNLEKIMGTVSQYIPDKKYY